MVAITVAITVAMGGKPGRAQAARSTAHRTARSTAHRTARGTAHRTARGTASGTARGIVALLLVQWLAGCATATNTSGDERAAVDPLEGPNRAVFVFNDYLDRMLLAPVARGYNAITPIPVKHGIRNFFANLYDLNGAVNAALQGRFTEGMHNTGRFVVNSSVGLLGFLDVATGMGIESYRTDFGHTLATWGVPRGPYLMVPFLGPRTVRSGTGTLFDSVASLQWQLDLTTRSGLLAVEAVDNRASLISAEDLITGDRYVFVRDAYLQQRDYFVGTDKPEDSFSDFEGGFDDGFEGGFDDGGFDGGIEGDPEGGQNPTFDDEWEE